MATKKKTTTKKKATTKKNELVAVSNELTETNLSSSALASLASYDASHFEGVDLDVTDNKELFSNDIIIPKLWLMQEMSDLAKDKSRKDIESGDFVDSQSEEVLLKIDGEKTFLPLIVMKTFKRWQTFKIVGEKKEFVSSEIMVFGRNHDLPYEFTEDGNEYKRRQVISAYVLLGEDAQKGIVKPYVIDFASTSKGGGRALVSDIKVLNAKKLPSYVAWFKLSTHEDSYNDHDFFVKDIKFGGLLPEQMMPFLKEAYTEITSMIDSNAIEIDDRDVNESAKQASANVVNEASDNAGI